MVQHHQSPSQLRQLQMRESPQRVPGCSNQDRDELVDLLLRAVVEAGEGQGGMDEVVVKEVVEVACGFVPGEG